MSTDTLHLPSPERLAIGRALAWIEAGDVNEAQRALVRVLADKRAEIPLDIQRLRAYAEQCITELRFGHVDAALTTLKCALRG